MSVKMPLTFLLLNNKNVTRCERDFHKVDSWSHNDWGVAFAGEAGEACNKLKKLRRGDFPSNRFTREMIADEIADTVIYADLLCERLGVSLEEAIVRKFNEVSDRRGSDIKL